MQLILLAAGRGSRLPKSNRNKPKCLTKIKGKTIFQHNEKFFDKFKNKIVITGYKKNLISKLAKKKKFKIIFNKNYKNSNMVHSMFLAKKKITGSVIICYGDIIFNQKIYKILKKNIDSLPLNYNWKKNWLKRMSFSKMLLDAENVIIKKGYISEIGTPLSFKKLPEYQFMGLIKLRKKTFFKLFEFYKNLKNSKIDMTSFLNKAINKKFLKLKCLKYKSFWHEIDNIEDIKAANKLL
tara:strand:+ start:121 stop:834 length:714 start_codon:yes stop_codon:yes gene_type:complete